MGRTGEAFGSGEDRKPLACYTRALAWGRLHLEHSGRRIGTACPADPATSVVGSLARNRQRSTMEGALCPELWT